MKAKQNAATKAQAANAIQNTNGKPTNGVQVKATGNGTLKVVKAEEKPLKTTEAAKPEKAFNLQGTLKVVDSLHRRVVQRTNLIAVIDNLETFTIKQVEDEHGRDFVGCEITIKDDERNTWTTKNTFLIAAIVKYAKEVCTKRLAEIEAGIVLPAA